MRTSTAGRSWLARLISVAASTALAITGLTAMLLAATPAAASGSSVTVLCVPGDSNASQANLQSALNAATTAVTLNISPANCSFQLVSALMVGTDVAITINGNGLVIDANSHGGFVIGDPGLAGSLTLNQVTIQNAFNGIAAGGDNGSVTLNQSAILNSERWGIWIGGDIQVNNSTLAGNGLTGAMSRQGNITLRDSSIVQNGSLFDECDAVYGNHPYNCDGVWAENGNVTVTSSHIGDNANIGVAANADSGTATITDSTIDHNGGLMAIFAHNVTLANSTVVDNVYMGVFGSSATVTSSTIAQNGTFGLYTSTATVAATILDENPDGNCAVVESLTDAGYNLSTDDSCGFTASGSRNRVDGDAIALGSLSGTTPAVGAPSQPDTLQTMTPGSGSIAIDAIPLTSRGECLMGPSADEIGTPRPLGSGCDIGSVEVIEPYVAMSSYTSTVRQGYWAVIRIAALSPELANISGRGLRVTSVELDGPNGQAIPFRHAFQFGRFGGTAGYQLLINTRNLSPGSWTLQFTVGSRETTGSARFTVE